MFDPYQYVFYLSLFLSPDNETETTGCVDGSSPMPAVEDTVQRASGLKRILADSVLNLEDPSLSGSRLAGTTSNRSLSGVCLVPVLHVLRVSEGLFAQQGLFN